MENNDKKLTLKEYQEKYSDNENSIKYLFLLNALIAVIFIICFWIGLSIFKTTYSINKIFGYVSTVLYVIVCILFVIVPTGKAYTSLKFHTNIKNYKNLKKAKRYNNKVRKQLAKKIISFHCEVEKNVSWYTDEKVEKLINAKNNSLLIKDALNDIYATDIKKQSNKIITKTAISSCLSTALSQNGLLDSMLVASINLQMIKDIVYLYGFRPSDKKMLEIYKSVIGVSLTSLGVSKVGGLIGGAIKNMPLVGTIIDSSIQGISNAVLTVLVGNNTIKYLIEEYKLQDIIDTIEIPSEEVITAMCKEAKSQIIKGKTQPATA